MSIYHYKYMHAHSKIIITKTSFTTKIILSYKYNTYIKYKI
jgi:hypothetical protein